MQYIFKLNHIGLTESRIDLFRGRFLYKSYSFSEVSLMEINKGHLSKYPIRQFVFGILLLSAALYVILELDIMSVLKGLGKQTLLSSLYLGLTISGLIFCIGIAIVSLYHAVLKGNRIEFRFEDDTFEIVSLSSLSANEVNAFKEHLTKINIHNR